MEPSPSNQSTAETRPHEAPPTDSGPSPAVTPTAQQLSLLQATRKLQRLNKLLLASSPYFSTKTPNLVALNGQVEVQTHPGPLEASNQKVVCRHLAVAFAKELKKRNLMEALSTQQGIQERFDKKWSATEFDFYQLLQEGPQSSKHVTNNDHFGLCLESIAHQLKPPGSSDGPSQANCILMTTGHAMALNVEKKQKEGIDYITVKVYDPNITNQFSRVERLAPEFLRDLKLQNMLPTGEAGLNLYCPGQDKSVAVISLDPNLQPGKGQTIAEPSPQSMNLAMKSGMPDTVRQMLDLVAAQSDSGTSEKLFELFQAKSIDGNNLLCTGLVGTLAAGGSNMVGVCVDWVLGSEFTNQQKVELLEARFHKSDGEEAPGLMIAFERGNHQTLKIFVEKILGSDLTTQEKVHLLNPKESSGQTGFTYAFSQGNAETVRVFTKTILDSNLDLADKLQLLTTKDENGYNALGAAFSHFESSRILAFTETVLTSNLDSNAKVELLSARKKGSDDIPALFHAFSNERFHTVHEFTDLVLASDLDSAAKVELLDVKDRGGISGLSIAIRLNASDAVRTFTEAVLSSNLGPEEKVQLLSPKLDSESKRDSRMAMHRFTQAIRRSDLSDTHKDSILSAHKSVGATMFDLTQRFARRPFVSRPS